MEGDSCSRHLDRIAIGYYSDGGSFGLNGCKECMEKNPYKTQFYDMKKSKEIFDKDKASEKLATKKLLEDDSKSCEVNTCHGDHWVLFGKDKIDCIKEKRKVNYAMKFQDKRSYYYDSSD